MSRLEPVVWTRGTFLTPQHLQCQDRFLEDLIHFQGESLTFRPWGFRTLPIDRGELAAGTFRIAAASGIFADGLPFEFPHSDRPPAAKPLADCFGAGQKAVDVWLAVPGFHERGLNLSANNGDGRYRPEIEVLPDENTGPPRSPCRWRAET